MIFFEILSKKIGLSRIGRFPKSKFLKKHLKTPHLLIPINKTLMKQFKFIKEFYDHDTFVITNERFLKKDFLLEKFKNSGVIYTHNGTMDEFQRIFEKRSNIFKEYNIFASFPFNIPTTPINKEFAEREIENYLRNVENLLNKYPNIYFGLTIKIFGFPELIEKYIRIIQKYEKIQVLSLADLFDNFKDFRGIIKIIFKIKQELDNNIVLMASGRIIPKYYPILVYLGIDIIDASYLLYLSSENFYDTIEYLLPIYKIRNLPCSCVSCRGRLGLILTEKYSSEKVELLCLHNLITAKNYINKIIQYLNYEDFRAFVEKTSLDDTYIISLLRVIDKDYHKYLRNETPINQIVKQVNCLGPSSYYRPDFLVFRNRIEARFIPEPWTKLIILLPCSATKPYSESPSHKKILNVLRNFPEFPSFQEIILTSPLGSIPRQLENIYPVNSYDISVTGEWDREEIRITSSMLMNIIKKYDKNILDNSIIDYSGDSYKDVVGMTENSLNSDFYHPFKGSVTSKESLQLLKETIQKILVDKVETKIEEDRGITDTWSRKCRKILDYQYGVGSGPKVFPNGVKIRRNRENTKIQLNDPNSKITLGNFKFNTGQIALSLKGAERLTPFSDFSKQLVFDGEKIEGNTLFRPGVIEYSQDLIPEEIALILNKNKTEIIGLGQLFVSSNFIKNSKTGRIAKVYAKK
jgi:archaeosine synthase